MPTIKTLRCLQRETATLDLPELDGLINDGCCLCAYSCWHEGEDGRARLYCEHPTLDTPELLEVE